MTDDYDTGYQREPQPDEGDAVYKCPGLHGETAVEYMGPQHPVMGYKTGPVRGCRLCPAGLEYDTGVWMAIMYPSDQQGFLRFSEKGARKFDRFAKADADRAEKIKAKVLEAVERRNNERKRRLEKPPGWES